MTATIKLMSRKDRPFKVTTEDGQIICFEPSKLLTWFHEWMLEEPKIIDNENFLRGVADLVADLDPKVLFYWAERERNMQPYIEGRSEEIKDLLISAITDFGKRMQEIYKQESEEMARFYEEERRNHPRKPELSAMSRVT